MTTTSFHVSLNVADLSRAIEFYRSLFGIEPAKSRSDYAKFELAGPPLALALNPASPAGGPQRLSHLGVRVASSAELEAIRERVAAAGLPMRDEGETVCCYALQRKFWVTDPDGNDWEFYELLADRETPRDEPRSACCPGSAGACP